MDINDGRFSMNGGCGYVLKPYFLRDDVSLYFASNIFYLFIRKRYLKTKVMCFNFEAGFYGNLK